jgi:pimeloyl-ACP methyl ester carboxylesterase
MRLLRIVKFLVLGVVGLVVLAGGALWSVRAIRQNSNVKAFAIASPHGIDHAGYVQIGGIPQWIQIRGHDRSNPVLLCVHGGPGGTWIPVTGLFSSWEKNFTVVFWDQRGAGKTLKATGPGVASTMTIERMTRDGIEVAEHVRKQLGKEKIVLLGHSFGSILGVRMVKERPDLFHAFVGTGQASDLPRSTALEFERVRQLAQNAHDVKTVEQLQRIGPPPFSDLQEASVFFQSSGKYQSQSDNAALDELKRSLLSPVPDYSIADEINRFRGFAVVPPWSLYQEMLGTKLASLGGEFTVPVFVFQGTADFVTPAALADEYVQSIRAPHKEFVTLPDGGHFAVWTMAERFRTELVNRVRPLALPPTEAIVDAKGKL